MRDFIVVAHGSVESYCKKHHLKIGSHYYGELEKYRGAGTTVVTDQKMSKNEFYYLKYRLLRYEVDLYSLYWNIEDLNDFVVYMNECHHGNYRGRPKFGFVVKNGVLLEDTKKQELARRIISLRDSGMTMRGIYAEIDTLSIGTIRTILRNRELYE